MTGDERDRILGLLSTGPATVARLAIGLGLPGGVVSYQLRLLEQEGLARTGTMRGENGSTIPVWVSTAEAASPPLRIPAALPGLTWTGDGPYPIPVWTTPRPPEPATAAGEAGATRLPGEADSSPAEALDEPVPAGERHPREYRPTGEEHAGESPSSQGRSSEGRSSEGRSSDDDRSAGQGCPSASLTTAPPPVRAPQPRRPDRSAAEPSGGPRLLDVRRVPVDDATFYEFATRLDALAREFVARATPGAPVAELTVVLTRPTTAGYGS